MKEKKKRWTAARKAELIVESLKGTKTIAELCREHGISQSQFFEWKKQFVDAGTSALVNGGKSTEVYELEEHLAEAQRKLGEMVIERDIALKAYHSKHAKKKTR